MAKRKLPKSTKRKPRILKRHLLGVPFGRRMYAIILRFAGRNKLKIKIRYKRIQDGGVQNYTIDPYSVRYRATREGIRKMLFGYHTGIPQGSLAPDRDYRIHNFAIKNIQEMTLQNRIFRPRWPVEFGR